MVQRTSLQEDCPADHPDYRVHRAARVPQGWKGFLRSHRKHDAVAAQLLVSIVQV